MQMPLLFSVYPAPRYGFRRGMSIFIPDSPIATAGALLTVGFANISRDGSKGLPPVPLQAVEQKESFFAVFGGQPVKVLRRGRAPQTLAKKIGTLRGGSTAASVLHHSV